MNKIRFGVIGGGMIGPFHAEAISQLDDAELVAVATTKEQTAKPFAEKFGVKAWYTDYRDLLQRKDIDAVNVCTPNFLREEITTFAAEHGKHVLVEKPIAMNLMQADKMIEACQKAGVKLGVIFQHRFAEDVILVKKTINKGGFGKLIMGDVYVKWFRTQKYYDSGVWRGTLDKEGGGALINQAVHTIDLLQWFMGDVDRLFAFVDTAIHKIDVEDIAVATVRFKSGALGVIEGSTAVYPGLPARLDIHGERGTAILQDDSITFSNLVGLGRKKSQEETRESRKLGDTSSDPRHHTSEKHRLQIKDFIEAIKEDREPLVNGVEGRKSLEIIWAIYQSAKTGATVKFPVKV